MLKQDFEAVRGLIEAGWSQRSLARDRDGNTVSVYSDKATNFCLVGAMLRVYPAGNIDHMKKPFHKRNIIAIGVWNDPHSKKDVLKLLEDIIQKDT